MAAADYHLCAICAHKVFYDAQLGDDYIDKYYKKQVIGLCNECFKKYEIVVKPRSIEEAEEIPA